MQKKKEHKKRIGLVLNSVPSYSETFFTNKIKGLQTHGFEVFLFVSYDKGRRQFDLCPVVSLPDFAKLNLKSVFKIVLNFFQVFLRPKRSWKLYRLDKSDGLPAKACFKHLLLNQQFLKYQLDWLHFGFGTLVKGKENLAEAIGAKMGVSFRGFDLYLSPLKHPDCFKLLFTKRVKYHVLAQEMKETLMLKGIPGDTIQVITPAIDVKFFKNPLNGKLFHDPVQLTTIARLHWKKGLDYTLEALAMLKAEGFNFNYTIVGAGDQYERLVLAVHQFDLKSEVEFVGKLPPRAVKEVYEKTDIYLQYSIQEGFCNSVLEAQAMGLLCIVSNAEGLSENIQDQITGWVIPKRKPYLLKEAILKVANLSENEKKDIGYAAMQRVKKDFNLQKQQESFLKFYSE